MIYNIKETSVFLKDLKKQVRDGLDISDLKQAVEILMETGTLPEEFKTHKLTRDYSDVYDSHLDDDLILLWKKNRSTITLLRIGTHEDLF